MQKKMLEKLLAHQAHPLCLVLGQVGEAVDMALRLDEEQPRIDPLRAVIQLSVAHEDEIVAEDDTPGHLDLAGVLPADEAAHYPSPPAERPEAAGRTSSSSSTDPSRSAYT